MIKQLRVTVPTPPFKVWGKKFEYDSNIKKKLFSNSLLAWKLRVLYWIVAAEMDCAPWLYDEYKKTVGLVPLIDSAPARECNTKSQGSFINVVKDCRCQQGIKLINFPRTRKERDH